MEIKENNENKNIFKTLNDINVNDKTQEKIGLRYLSWAWAWSILKQHYPNAFMTIYTRKVVTKESETTSEQDGTVKVKEVTYENDVPYFTDGKTCYVKVGVTIEDIEYTELLPVMDNRNNAVALSLVTMTAVNKAIQRCFVKACARAGLGLYIYANEDLPEIERKIIDFKAIADRCDRYETKILAQDGFDQMKTDVINAVQAEYPEDAAKALIDYVTKTTNGKKLSMFDLEHDAVTLQRIYNFINEMKKELAAPSGK